jgi:hypothetical protein
MSMLVGIDDLPGSFGKGSSFRLIQKMAPVHILWNKCMSVPVMVFLRDVAMKPGFWA